MERCVEACGLRAARPRSRFPDGVWHWNPDVCSNGVASATVAPEGDDGPDAEGVHNPASSTPGEAWPKPTRRWKTLGPKLPAERCRADAALAWWRADAWAEALPEVATFLLSFLYELLPALLSGLVCWAVEGRISAQNRLLLFACGIKGQPRSVIRSTVPIQLVPLAFLLLWLVERPPEVSLTQVVFPLFLLTFRAACVAMKYAYLAPSDLDSLRLSTQWSKSGHSIRTLGLNFYFNAGGALAFDWLEQLFKSALRNCIVEEVRECCVQTSKETAHVVWREVRPALQALGASPAPTTVDQGAAGEAGGVTTGGPLEPQQHQSKYGNVQGLLGLQDLQALEAQVGEGLLPISVLSYYLVSRGFASYSPKWLWLLGLCSLAFGLLHPLVLHLVGRPAFGSSLAARAILITRCFINFVLCFPCLLYLAFPLCDAFNRLWVSYALLASFQCPEAQAQRLLDGRTDLPLGIHSPADLQAFWALSRLLGSGFELGLSTRYGSAFVATSVLFLVAATTFLSATAATDARAVEWGVTVELAVLFALGAASVLCASLLSLRLNSHVPLYVQVARRSALRKPELGMPVENVCADLELEFLQLHPVRIMFMAATPELISFLWSGLTVLIAVFVNALPDICVPLPLLQTAACMP